MNIFLLMFTYRDKFSDDDDTPIVHLTGKIFNKKMRKYRIDSDDSDYEETNDEDDDEEYHTISDVHNYDSGKAHLADIRLQYRT